MKGELTPQMVDEHLRREYDENIKNQISLQQIASETNAAMQLLIGIYNVLKSIQNELNIQNTVEQQTPGQTAGNE